MKSREFQNLAKKYLLPYLPDFKLKGNLIYHREFTYLLTGLYKDRRSNSKAFTLWAFVQPLFVPDDDVYFNYGDRLGSRRLGGRGGERWWDNTQQDNDEIFEDVLRQIKREAIPFFKRFKTTRDFYNRYFRKDKNSHYKEEACYAAILSGEYEEAMRLMEQYIEVRKADLVWLKNLGLPDKETEQGLRWRRAKIYRVNKMRRLLADSPEEAIAQLNKWTEVTVRNLGMER